VEEMRFQLATGYRLDLYCWNFSYQDTS